MKAGRSATIDALLYAASAVVAGVVAVFAGIPLQREWGRLAFPVYVGGAIAAGLLGSRRPRGGNSRALRWLALVVLVGAALLPLGLEAHWRSRTHLGLHAQSEAIITEEAAKVLRRGIDPYVAEYLHGPLEARPLGTRTHFPYLPAMITFGVPRAMDGRSPLADARIAFATFTLALVALALIRPPLRSVSERHRRMTFLVQIVLPTGALLMATGGDDLPVLALLFLSLVLTVERRPGTAALVAGLAGVMKQTAWILLPFLLLGARDREGRPARARFGLVVAAVLAVGVLPFFAWSPDDFVEDVVRFPLGLGQQPSAAESPTLGGFLIRLIPSWRGPLTVMLVGLVLALVVFLLVKHPPAAASEAAMNAGIVFAAAILLAPAARFGYVVYPIDLFVWAWVLRAAEARA